MQSSTKQCRAVRGSAGQGAARARGGSDSPRPSLPSPRCRWGCAGAGPRSGCLPSAFLGLFLFFFILFIYFFFRGGAAPGSPHSSLSACARRRARSGAVSSGTAGRHCGKSGGGGKERRAERTRSGNPRPGAAQRGTCAGFARSGAAGPARAALLALFFFFFVICFVFFNLFLLLPFSSFFFVFFSFPPPPLFFLFPFPFLFPSPRGQRLPLTPPAVEEAGMAGCELSLFTPLPLKKI